MQIVVSAPRALPPAARRTAGRIPGVVASGRRVRGLLNLEALRGANRPFRRGPAGSVVPISVTGVDHRVLSAFPGTRAAANAIRRGHAVIPESVAQFRGLAVGDSVTLTGSGRRAPFRIGAITRDEAGTRSEITIPARAAISLGLRNRRSLVLAVAPEAAGAAHRALERALGESVRIRSAIGGVGFGSGQLSLFEVKQMFGEFWYRRTGAISISIDPAWRRANIARTRVPVLGTVLCHRKIIPMLRGAMTEVRDRGLADLIRSFDGCYVPRMQSNNASALSLHAFGIAFDINSRWNGYGARPTLDPRIVEILERWGFLWGGRWRTPDGMHFEATRPAR